MDNNLSRYTLRISKQLLDKLGYIAEYEGRTKNKELEQMIKKRILPPSRAGTGKRLKMPMLIDKSTKSIATLFHPIFTASPTCSPTPMGPDTPSIPYLPEKVSNKLLTVNFRLEVAWNHD